MNEKAIDKISKAVWEKVSRKECDRRDFNELVNCLALKVLNSSA